MNTQIPRSCHHSLGPITFLKVGSSNSARWLQAQLIDIFQNSLFCFELRVLSIYTDNVLCFVIVSIGSMQDSLSMIFLSTLIACWS